MSDSEELRRLGRGIVRARTMIVLLMVVAGLASWGLTTRMTPVYEATTTVLVGDGIKAPDVNTEDLQASQSLALTYADLVRRQPVMEGVVRGLGLDISWLQLRERVRVDLAPQNSQLIIVRVEAGSTREAEAIAARTAQGLVGLSPSGQENDLRTFVQAQLDTLQAKIEDNQKKIVDLQSQLPDALPEDASRIQLRIDLAERLVSGWQNNYAALIERLPKRGAPTTLEVVDSAYASPTPVRPNTTMNVLIAVALAALAGVGVGYLRQVSADRREEAALRQAREVQSYAARMRSSGYEPSLRTSRPSHVVVRPRPATNGSAYHAPDPDRGRRGRR